jgi:hypothetical protein
MTSHIKGELEMTQTQISCAIALLDRSVPKLALVQHMGPGDEGQHKIEVTLTFK